MSKKIAKSKSSKKSNNDTSFQPKEISKEELEQIIEKSKTFDLNSVIYSLLTSEPFFAAISRKVTKIKSSAVPTAGVRINPHTTYFEMFYNPIFFCQLTVEQCKAVIKHEYYHLIFEHITTRNSHISKDQKMLWNIAADLAINSYLKEELPEGCCIPGIAPYDNFPLYMTAEWYFSKMLEDPEKYQPKTMKIYVKFDGSGSQEGEPSGQFDSHEFWDDPEVDETTREIAKQRLKEMMSKAAQEASGKGWGSIPQQIQKDILERIRSTVDWKSVLRYFVRTSQRSETKSTVRKINRKYPYSFPGKKITRQSNIAISIDQSGSVSDQMLTVFFSEIESLSKIATFTVIPFDTEVCEKDIFEWKRGKKIKNSRVRCGGTDFNAPTKYVNDSDFDGHIILTDMIAPKPIPSYVQRMWMTDIHTASNPPFHTLEKIIPINVPQE